MFRKGLFSAALAALAGSLGLAGPALAQVQPIQPGVTGAWTVFHISNAKNLVESAVADGALLSGPGTFTFADNWTLDAKFGSCWFHVVLVAPEGQTPDTASHGTYLVYGGSGDCKGLTGSGHYRIYDNGNKVFTRGPLYLPQAIKVRKPT
jgi:hypothetical protein